MIRIAHRGLHDRPDRPPNSRSAVTAALESPADGLEVDLRMLGDGRFVLHHDPHVTPECGSKLTPSPRLLAGMTLREFQDAFDHERLTLGEFLDLPGGEKTRILECKTHPNRIAFARRLVHRLDTFANSGNILLSSSDDRILRELHQRSNHPLAPVIYPGNSLLLNRVRAGYWQEVHLHESLCSKPFLQRLVPYGADDVLAWTVNDPASAQRLETMGIKGIMTDVSELLHSTN